MPPLRATFLPFLSRHRPTSPEHRPRSEHRINVGERSRAVLTWVKSPLEYRSAAGETPNCATLRATTKARKVGAMLTIEASADQVAVLSDGRYVIAKPPVRRVGAGAQAVSVTDALHPPADLVAVTESCQTCGGRHQAIASSTGQRFVDGKLHSTGAGWRTRTTVTCTDCALGGRPLFDLKVECDFPHEELGCVRLPSCDRGFVTHAGLYVPGPLLPVEDEADHDQTVDGPRIVVLADGTALLFDSDHYDDIALPAAAGPGGYAAIAERSEGRPTHRGRAIAERKFPPTASSLLSFYGHAENDPTPDDA